jgi:transcriptional regulator with XRE-family HTH domain
MDKKQAEDASMARVRALFAEKGWSLQELGERMGYPLDSARKSAWQFMRTGDPRISMLRRFAVAVGINLEELTGVPVEKPGPRKRKARGEQSG